jgi:hypothetical protein
VGDGTLYQHEAVEAIRERFGDAFVYQNDNGNLAIRKPVLDAFRKLTPNFVWARRSQYWRRREPDDEPGKRQVDE